MRLIDATTLKAEFTGNFQSDYSVGEIHALIDTAPTVGGWISVEDRLPEKEGRYLCWFGKNTVAIGAAIATYLEMWKAFGSLESFETYPNVTHWMPLPEPPEVTDDDA